MSKVYVEVGLEGLCDADADSWLSYVADYVCDKYDGALVEPGERTKVVGLPDTEADELRSYITNELWTEWCES